MEALRLGLYTWFGRMLCILFTSLTHVLLTSGITLRAIRKFFVYVRLGTWDRGEECSSRNRRWGSYRGKLRAPCKNPLRFRSFSFLGYSLGGDCIVQ